MMTIGEKIKSLRIKANLTQEELAIAADTTKQTIHKYETGIITNIPASKIKALADRLSTTPAFLMGWDEPSVATTKNLSNYTPITVYNYKGTPGAKKIEINDDNFEAIGDLITEIENLPAEKIKAITEMIKKIK